MKKISVLLIVSIMSLVSIFGETMTIDIETAIELLHQNNLNIQAKAFDVRIAEREKKTVWNAFLPTLGVSASSSLTDAAGMMDPEFNFNVGVNATLPINYALGAGIKNYRLLYESGEITYEMAVKGLEKGTKIQFYNLLFSKERINIKAKEIELTNKRYQQAQENYNNGLIPELDVLRTQVAYESQKPILSTMETEYNNSLMGFKVMLGIERDQHVSLDGSLNTNIYTFETENLINNYLSKSLSLKSMQKTLEVMENGKSISALYAYTPMLTFSYQHNLLTYNPFTTSPLEEEWSYNNSNGIGMGVFTISLSFSLDNYIPGSKSDVEIKNSKDQITQMKLQIQSAALDSEVEIINTLAKLENSIEQLEANKLNAELARKAYEMTSEAYQLGTKELLDVESAQNDLLSAEVAVLGVQLSYITELLNLEYTLNTSVEEILK